MSVTEIETKGRTLRIWWQELPDLEMGIIEERKLSIRAPSAALSTQRCAAIEVLRHAHGPSSYGLLGAIFIPAVAEKLEICIPVTTAVDHKVAWTNSGGQDVYSGLLPEFIEGIMRGVSVAQNTLGSGELTFTSAAYSAGSSIWFFDQITTALVKLLARDASRLSNQELIELLDFPVRQSS